MPLQKPRGRKQASHKKAYASLAVLVLLLVSAAAYAYINGYFPVSTTSTTSTTSAAAPQYALVTTSKGSFEIELFTASAPHTVANFVSLVSSGFYTNLTWHRIVPGFVIQVGDPNTKNGGGNRATWGQGTSGTSVPFEDDPTLHNYAGYVAMASTSARVGGSSQLYINLVNNTDLDGNYAVFGKVLNGGMSVVNALAAVNIYTSTSSPEYSQPVVPSQAMVYSITMLSGP